MAGGDAGRSLLATADDCAHRRRLLCTTLSGTLVNSDTPLVVFHAAPLTAEIPKF